MRRLLAPVAILAILTGCDSPRQGFDLIIRGGQVYDGLAEEPRRADVAILGDRIAAVGDLIGSSAAQEINASGLTVAPGFIDVQARSGTTLLAEGIGESHLRQGITSVILGDVDSPAFWTPQTADAAALRPFGLAFDWTGIDGYFERLLQRGVAMNVGTLIPLALTDGSEAAIDAAMRRGALGLSTTRESMPDPPLTTPELIALARVVARHGGVFAIQVAGTPDRVMAGIDEAIEIARQARLPVVLYEPQIIDATATTLGELLAKIRAARTEGVTIHAIAAPGDSLDEAQRVSWFRHSGASVGSQSAAVDANGVLARRTAHPRADDAFSRVLAQYVREDNVLSIGEAIRRMTSTAATQFRLDGRGAIRVGSVADLIVFDPANVRSPATTGQPHQYATGVHHVIVNGVVVLHANGLTGSRPGRALFSQARSGMRPGS